MALPASTPKIWKVAPPLPNPSTLTREADVTPLQAQLLHNRGVSDPDAARAFLSSRLCQMADPMKMKGMQGAVKSVLNALENQKKITIYGDYDADGLTATALLLNFFSALHADVDAYIPDRLTEGYGLNADAIRSIAKKGADLLITVDCGISGVEESRLAMHLGMKVVVTDHHQVPPQLTHACPVINPRQPGCSFEFKSLSGVGVAFFLAVAVRAALRERGWFTAQPEPDLRTYMDLVALGTVADRVPLIGQNRLLAVSGLKWMAHTRWPGVRALMAVSGVDGPQVDADDLAFRLAPRLNAPGRLGDADLGLRILTEEDPQAATDLASEMDRMNVQRRNLEKKVLSDIENRLKEENSVKEGRRTLVFGGIDWHQGVLGIVASRLVDKYHRPALVFSIADGMATGSGRSITGFNLYKALHHHRALFTRFGGHAHAAGMRLDKRNICLLEEGFEALASKVLSDEDLVPVIDVDAELRLESIGDDLIHQLNRLAPFGEQNKEPVFAASSVEVLESGVVGDRHLKMKVGQGSALQEAIGFRMGFMKPMEGSRVDLLFTPEYNRWRGRDRIQLRLVDLRPSGSPGISP